jgi:hypothetical protein
MTKHLKNQQIKLYKWSGQEQLKIEIAETKEEEREI